MRAKPVLVAISASGVHISPEERVEFAWLIPQERIQRRTVMEVMDALVLETHEEIVAAVKVQHVMMEIVEVVRLIPQECVQRAMEEIVDVVVAVIKGIPQECVQRTIERGVDLPVPLMAQDVDLLPLPSSPLPPTVSPL